MAQATKPVTNNEKKTGPDGEIYSLQRGSNIT
jgi:hypothetical protein